MSRGFAMHLQSAARYERIDGVVSFVGTDGSGSFGLLPGHARYLTVLDYGLARFRTADARWHYLACPGAVLHFLAGELFIGTRRYLLDDDHARISALLVGQLAAEEAALAAVKDNLQHLERELFRRLRELQRETT